MSKRQEKRQQITFDDSSNIIYIIPSIEEIKDIKSDLWWTLAELANIKHNASQEIKCFIKKHPNIKNNQVIKQLFISSNLLSDDIDSTYDTDSTSSNTLYNNTTYKQISRTQTHTNLFSICEQSDQNKNQNKDNQDLDFLFLMDDI
jgi:hypothetical protein